METLKLEQEGLFSESSLTLLGNKLLPVLGKYERWPAGKLEHMFASGEALQVTLLLAKLLEMGLSEDELIEKIREGQVTEMLQEVRKHEKVVEDPQSWLMDSINKGRRELDFILQSLEPHLGDSMKGFAVDLASGSTFFAQNFIRRWPGLKIYCAESCSDSSIVGTKFMRWSLRQFSESPERNFEELAQRQAAIKAGTAQANAQVNILDSLWYPSCPPYPQPERDALLSCQLEDRACTVDLLSEDWPDIAHLVGSCRLVMLLSWRPTIDDQKSDLWKQIVGRAAQLLSRGGVMLLASSQAGAYLDKQSMERFCAEECVELTVASFTDLPSSRDEEKFLCILKKGVACNADERSDEAANLAREQVLAFRDQGNRSFNAKEGRDIDQAISMYTRALDVHADGRFTDPLLASRLESNLSAALFEKARFLEALDAADGAARWDPSWCKAQFRRMKALSALGRKGDAIAASVQCDALKVEADCNALKAEVEAARVPASEEAAQRYDEAVPNQVVQQAASPPFAMRSLLKAFFPQSCSSCFSFGMVS